MIDQNSLDYSSTNEFAKDFDKVERTVTSESLGVRTHVTHRWKHVKEYIKYILTRNLKFY